MSSDIFTPVTGGRLSRPRSRHNQTSRCGHSRAQRIVDSRIGGVTYPQVVAGDDEQLCVGLVAEGLSEGCHSPHGTTGATACG